MKIQYASFNSPQAPLVTVTNNGNLTSISSGTKYFYFQCQGRGGFSLLSAPTTVQLTAGKKVEITIPSSARQPGWDIRKFLILVSDTANEEDTCVIATAPGYLINGVDVTVLPVTITISYDEQLRTGVILASRTNLPTTNLISGMRRYIDAEAVMLEYDARINDWATIKPSSFSTYISSTTDSTQFGADRSLEQISSSDGMLLPEYNSSVGGMSEPVKYWLVNDSLTPIPQGTRLRAIVNVGDIDYSSEFAGKVFITPLGYVNLQTGALDTAITGAGTDYTYQGDVQSDILLSKPLPAGWAYAISTKLNYRDYEVNNEVLQGSSIKVIPRFANTFAKYDEGGELLGDYILPELKQRRIVPRRGSAAALPGSGRVAGYTWKSLGEEAVVSMAPNTANQKVLISNNGSVFAGNITETTKQRALVGTVNGVGKLSNWFTVALDNTKNLKISITHPEFIRPDYPDAIAASQDGEFNASRVLVFIKTADNKIYKYVSTNLVAGDTISVYELDALPSESSLPVAMPINFGLYEPQSITITAVDAAVNNESDFTNGNVQVAVAYEYDGEVTSISHDVNAGCIYEVASTIADVMRIYQSWGDTVRLPMTPRDIPESKTFPYQARYFNRDSIIFIPDSGAVDDGMTTWKPSWLENNELGRWHVDNFIRYQVSVTTPVLTSQQTANITAPLGVQCSIYKVTTSSVAWVRVYQSTVYRAADVARGFGVNPVSGMGLILEVETMTQLAINLSPIASAVCVEVPPTNNIPIAVTNLSNQPTSVTVVFDCYK